jgi:hypothetical protein
VYYYLVQSMKRRLLLELKDSFSKHPVYDKIVPFIENKFSFDQRPQFGIVCKNSNATKVSLAADNFIGPVMSHVMLAYVGEPKYPIEWVVEDKPCIDKNNGVMPINPGLYYIEILEAPEIAQGVGHFCVDPLIEVPNEAVLYAVTGTETSAQLEHPPLPGTLRLWENNRYRLTEGTDYFVNYEDGSITFAQNGQGPLLAPGSYITAGYYFSVETIGPVPFTWNQANFTTLPGVIMAFGKRARAGDKVAVKVWPDRVHAANATGGRFDLTFDLEIISQDPHQMEEIVDLAVMYLWGVKRPILSFEGIEITEVGMGGEVEETYDEQAKLMYYMGSMNVTINTPWEIHHPVPLTLTKVAFNPGISGGTGVQDPAPDVGAGLTSQDLFFATAPVILGRNNNFERIL